MPKVIVIYASFGHGHKKAAEALGQRLNAPACDLLDFCPRFISKVYSWWYFFISHHFRYIWQVAFFLAKTNFISNLINLWHKLLFASLFRYLDKEQPELIITTHFFPAGLAAYIKPVIDFKLISVITDIRVHPIWVNQDIDRYFTSFKITKDDLVSLGVAPEKIATGFMPLREGFRKNLSRERLAKQFNLDSQPTILFVSSSRGVFPSLRQSLNILLRDFNVFIIYGRNKKLRRYLETINSQRLRFFPFYENIWELMFLASVIVTKPGGMTIFEGAYYQKPFIFPHYIPGQEKDNMDVFIKAGVAKFAKTKQDLLKAVQILSQKHDLFQKDYPFKLENIQPELVDLTQSNLYLR